MRAIACSPLSVYFHFCLVHAWAQCGCSAAISTEAAGVPGPDPVPEALLWVIKCFSLLTLLLLHVLGHQWCGPLVLLVSYGTLFRERGCLRGTSNEDTAFNQRYPSPPSLACGL